MSRGAKVFPPTDRFAHVKYFHTLFKLRCSRRDKHLQNFSIIFLSKFNQVEFSCPNIYLESNRKVTKSIINEKRRKKCWKNSFFEVRRGEKLEDSRSGFVSGKRFPHGVAFCEIKRAKIIKVGEEGGREGRLRAA